MLDLTEYKEYITANKDLLSFLKEKESIIYDRFSDILKVLGYIDFTIDKYGTIEEEYEVFYEVGFGFLYNQLEEVKLYFDKYFNKSYSEFQIYEPIINYALYLDDLKLTLKEEELMNDDINQAINDVLEMIENILELKNGYNEEVFDEFNAIISSQIRIKRRILTTTEVFERIVEELEL